MHPCRQRGGAPRLPGGCLFAAARLGGSAGLGTAPARGADWQSGRRRPGNGSGFSGGRDPPEEAAAAARAARGERRERRAAAAGAERTHGRSNARPPELRRGVCLCVFLARRGDCSPGWRGPGVSPGASAFLSAASVHYSPAKFGVGNTKLQSFLLLLPRSEGSSGVMSSLFCDPQRA